MSAFHDPLDTSGPVEPIHRHSEDDPSADAGVLADEILDWLGSIDPADFSQESQDRLNQMLARLEAVSPADGADTQDALKAFHLRYAPLFAEAPAEKSARNPHGPDIVRSPRFPSRRKIAAIAAAAVLTLGCMLTVQAFGVDVFGVITRWTEELFLPQRDGVPYASVQKNPLEDGENASFASLQEAVDAFGITAPIVPRWIPERFVLNSVEAVNIARGVVITAGYRSENGSLQIHFKETDVVDFNDIEKDNTTIELHNVEGIDHYFIYDSAYQKVFWQSGELECQISGAVTKEEMEKIVQSIYKENK